jgi:simple sugar transport system substrate-binding protein
MGYLPVVMLTLNARYGVLPISNIYTGPTAITSQDVDRIKILSRQGVR